MKFRDLLGSQLKSDFLIELFESYDVDVIYRYDRLYEGQKDEYVAKIPELNLEFLFDSSQRLITLFMNQLGYEECSLFSESDLRGSAFSTSKEAIDFAIHNGINYEHRQAKENRIFGEIPEWVKFNFEEYFIHYQFKNGGSSRVTLQLQSA